MRDKERARRDILICLEAVKNGHQNSSSVGMFTNGSMSIKRKWAWKLLKFAFYAIPICAILYALLNG